MGLNTKIGGAVLAPVPEPPIFEHEGELVIPTVVTISDNPLVNVERGDIVFTFILNNIDGIHGLFSRDGPGCPEDGEVAHTVIYVEDGTLKARMRPHPVVDEPAQVEQVMEVSGVTAGTEYVVDFHFAGHTVHLILFDDQGVVIGNSFAIDLSGFDWMGTSDRSTIIGALNLSDAVGIQHVMDGTITDLVISKLAPPSPHRRGAP